MLSTNRDSVGRVKMRAKNPPVLQYACLALLFLLASGYQLFSTVSTFPDYFHRHVAGYPFAIDFVNDKPLILSVEPKSPAQQAGVKVNDVFVSVNGHPIAGLAVYGEAIRLAKPGDSITVWTGHTSQPSRCNANTAAELPTCP